MTENRRVLTIAISTCDNELTSLIERLSEYSLAVRYNVQFLVVNQVGYDKVSIINSCIKVINSSSRGLSNNRNLCIENCDTKWIWFQDDDIELNIDETNKLISKLNSVQCDLYFVQISSLENKEKTYKNYNFEGIKSELISLKISSIEIVARVDFIIDKGLRFKKDLGLGALYPCCEENLFVLDCIRSNAKLLHYSSPVCYHTTKVENRMSKSDSQFVARGVLLRNFRIYFRVLLIIRWSCREFNGFGFWRSLYFMIKGLNIEVA